MRQKRSRLWQIWLPADLENKGTATMGERQKFLCGNAVSKGIAIAKAYRYEPLDLKVSKSKCDKEETEAECRRFQSAREQAKEELQTLYAALEEEHPDQAKIFVAHQEVLEDEEMTEETENVIKEDCLTAESAVDTIFNQYADLLKQVEDPLIAGRAADFLDVKARVLRLLLGKEEKRLDHFAEDVIVVAHDLLPSDTANLDRDHVKGLTTEVGGSNSHCAILARSFSLPAILGAEDAMTQIQDGQDLILDGLTGQIWLDFSQEEKEQYEQKRQLWKKQIEEEQTYLLRPGATKDEVKIALGINVGSDAYDTAGAAYDFIGLFRTEFLYMENDHMPTEEEQFSVYRRILEGAKGKSVTLRTLDIGGDKTLPYFSLPKEDNPFLGERALRLCFSHMEIFETQMRAALRASVYGNLQIMFPMVGSMEDIRKAKEAVRKVMDALKQEGIAYDPKVKIGVMIEVPSLALQADLVAQEVDFASIGSNDLTQYVCAADRMNAAMEPYYQTYAPAMVRLLGFVFESFQKANKPISVCGEMAGNPKGAALLVGLGARKLSMNAAMLAAVKAELARHRIDELEKMAKTCQELCTEKEIKEQMEM